MCIDYDTFDVNTSLKYWVLNEGRENNFLPRINYEISLFYHVYCICFSTKSCLLNVPLRCFFCGSFCYCNADPDNFVSGDGEVARRLRAKFWPDCAIPDTSMKFGTDVDHD